MKFLRTCLLQEESSLECHLVQDHPHLIRDLHKVLQDRNP